MLQIKHVNFQFPLKGIDFVSNSDNSDCDTSVVVYAVMKKMILIVS